MLLLISNKIQIKTTESAQTECSDDTMLRNKSYQQIRDIEREIEEINNMVSRINFTMGEMEKKIVLKGGLDNSELLNDTHILNALNEINMSLYQNVENCNNVLDSIKNHSDTWRDSYESIKNVYESTNSGTTYTRWGKTSCPGNSSEKIYSGFGGVNEDLENGGYVLCLSNDPEWKFYRNDTRIGYIRGIVYDADELFSKDLRYFDVPCAVCHVNIRSSMVMIPGRSSCYKDWIMEYSGYLMGSWSTDNICIDEDPDVVNWTEDRTKRASRADLYFMEIRCGSPKCTPYVSHRQLTCVVCTK